MNIIERYINARNRENSFRYKYFVGFNYITKYYRWELIEQDYDDNKFADCAIACNAHYLATNDKHFTISKRIAFPKVNVISVDEFKLVIDAII